MTRTKPSRATSAEPPDGSADVQRAALVEAYDTARAANDHSGMATAALALADMQMFGTVPGRLPAFLHDAYRHAEGVQRAQLAIAIARVWVYGGHPERAEEFADEALRFATELADPTLLAHAYDATLLTRWGPDHLDERLSITARLEDTVAHVPDVEVRMSAYLWRLTTALECLDLPTMRRQLRALEHLAEETGEPRVRFFAASRRAMHALLVGDFDAARRARTEAVAAGLEAGEPDAYAIDHALAGTIARHADDRPGLLAEAPIYEEFGVAQGVLSVAAEAAQQWAYLGEHAHAERLLHQLAGEDFARIPRDVDWLLSVTALTEVAATVGARDLAAAAVDLLTPYAGRGVVNAGAVIFAGVVDDYLAQAYRCLGREPEAAECCARALAAYERVGAGWWSRRLRDRHGEVRSGSVRLRPVSPDIWEVGRTGATIRDMKGLHYLRLLLQRPGVDIPARDLSDSVSGHPGSGTADGATIDRIDRRALAAYRQRLAELDEEIEQAREWSDDGRVAVLDAEREAILAEVRSATGLGGQVRPMPHDDERARVAVRKAIAASIERIAGVDASLGRLLTDTVSTGAMCRYEPDPDRPVTWDLTIGQT